ncbi:hypothetical protein CRUP_003998 [Coryphaenoides rupestris]|nr:hypothetical protein CRUP_003998 [Coryphaenoides rupestris]
MLYIAGRLRRSGLAALALRSQSLHANAVNDAEKWNGHFTKCPAELQHYCIHGSCRYIQEQSAPSCRCDNGFTGSRCEYLDLDLGWQIGERKRIIIVCVAVALLLVALLLVIVICLCSQ